jgi:hypothetical protein
MTRRGGASWTVTAVAILALLLTRSPAAHASDRATAERVLHMIYNNALYESEVDRLMREADHTPVFGGAGSPASARAKDRALTRDAMLLQRGAVLRDASERVAALATDAQLALLVQAAQQPDGPLNPVALDPAVAAVKRGFVEAIWNHIARYALSNANLLCRQGERSFCP